MIKAIDRLNKAVAVAAVVTYILVQVWAVAIVIWYILLQMGFIGV